MNRAARLIFQAALAAADPGPAVRRHLTEDNGRLEADGHAYRLADFDRLLVVGGGKAAASMGGAVEDMLGDRITKGLLVVPRGSHASLQRIEVVPASHPIPDESGVSAARAMLELVRGADEHALILCLLSGGGSALMSAPAPGLQLADTQAVTARLLGAGATIGELNAVRKHLSAIKGGKLARAAFPAAVLTLILSDVIGDRIDVIASGPTAPDATTFEDAASVLAKYGLWERIPSRAAAFLRRGLDGLEAETMKAGDPCFRRAAHVLVGSLPLALEAAAVRARELGFRTEIVSRELQGEARDAAHFLAERARQAQAASPPAGRMCLLSGGETTVRVLGSGRGGRNQELALAFAREISGTPGIVMLSAGTDGIDGPTDAAGAIVDGETVKRGEALGLPAAVFLENNDSYGFFSELDARSAERHHVRTGATGTNVMDIQVILFDRSAGQGMATGINRKSEEMDD